ncbi:MAG TPA: hypothetical protein VF757_05735 [Sphingomicrobium sp.]
MRILSVASAIALAGLSAPAAGQMHMPGMKMPVPQKKQAAPKKPAAKPKVAAKAATKKAGTTKKPAATHAAHEPAPPSSSMGGMTMPVEHGGMQMPSQAPPAGPSEMPMDHGQMAPMTMPMGAHAGHEMAMTGALGPYPMERESSGTAWQPDTSEHMGLHVMSGEWTLMAHGLLNLVYDHQSGPRGDDKAFASGMLMGMARRPLGNGTLQLKAMVSPDPVMGPSGYPLLLASGETANGRDRLIDRQHPHDFFMELSASVSQNIGSKSSVFLYAGLPGEPAFGPPAFMHRESILDSPEAPISHHWLDSTHISFGVLTGGIVIDRVKLEVSRFNGREPDQHRWDIETGPLDSTAIRLSWNPTRTLALQGSWGHFTDPEQLEPGVDQKRWSASALWADDVALGWKAAATLAWGRKTVHGHDDDAIAAEASVKHIGWTLFGRGEMTENRELLGVADGPSFRVAKVSLGAVRDFRFADHLALGAGGLFAVNFVPVELEPLYGGHNPTGAMAFVRLKLQ